MTLRCQILARESRVFIDDRLIWRSTEPRDSIAGKVRITLMPGSEIAEVRTRRIDPVPGRFEPIAIEGYLNASILSIFSGLALSRSHLLIDDAISYASVSE